MGIIEDRLAALEALKPERAKHKWRLERRGTVDGETYATGNYECPTCGGWMSGIKDPKNYEEGCVVLENKE